MCGISGFTGPTNVDLLQKITNRLIHRGPDSEGYYSNNKINLGMRRLSIVDLEHGQQPIFNENETICVIFNGEIYNYNVLRKDLENNGHIFRTDHSDTEVIVHLYEEYGADWVTHVDGMFGVAIWDKNNSRLLLYRDRLGKKPLYYARKNSQIIFASEIKSLLLHPAISHKINHSSIYQYVAFKHISAPDTIYHDIRQLLPGHMLIWQDNECKITPYWTPDFSPLDPTVSEDEASAHIHDLLQHSVEQRMNCDVPFGAYLSGGLDSSTVVTMMSKAMNKPVLTFCLGYEDKVEGQFKGKAQDLHYARQVAKQLGTEHNEYIINSQMFCNTLPELLAAFDEPFSGTISTYFLSKLISQHVKVALSGDGADELFGSYLTHRLSFPLAHYFDLQKKGKKDYKDLSVTDLELLVPFDTPDQFQFLKKIAKGGARGWRDTLSVFPSAERQKLFSQEFLKSLPPEVEPVNSLSRLSPPTAKDPLNLTLEYDQKELLANQILPFVDRLSMAHSVEVRCPFLDHHLVEFVNSLPGKFKIKNNINKYILKQSVNNLLPADLINRPKEGFVQPIYTWMHSDLKNWITHELQSLPKDIFNSHYLKALTERYQLGDTQVNAQVWNLTCYSIWHNNQENMP